MPSDHSLFDENHGLCKEAYRLKREHPKLSNSAIALRIGGASRDTVGRWLRNPDRFDPFNDEIAIRRALHGDREVYRRLTHWERGELMRSLVQMRRLLLEPVWKDFISDLRIKLGIDPKANGSVLWRVDEHVD